MRRFRAEADGYAPSQVIDVRLGANELRRHVPLALDRDPGSMASLVLELRDDRGQPVTGPLMIKRMWKHGSNGKGHLVRDGKVRIELPAGTHRLRVERDGHHEDPLPVPLLPKDLEVTLGREDERTLEVTLERGAWVVARVDENLLIDGPRVLEGKNDLGEFELVAGDWVALVEAKPCTVRAKYAGHGWVEVSLEPARGKTHTVDVRPKPPTVK